MNALDTGQLSRWKTACRLCLLEDGIKLPIFDEEGKQRQVSYKIQTCFPIVIYETDPLPKMICHKCLFKLETVFEFRLKCLDVNDVLLRHLETCGDADDIQEYWKALREHSIQQVVQDEHIKVKDPLILLDDKVKHDAPKKLKRVRKSTPPVKQSVMVPPLTIPHEKMMILTETTIGARGARVTRSGNVSGDVASDTDTANVFQEVFLDEVPADGFFPEQPITDGLAQPQDALAQDVDSAMQMKIVTAEELPSFLPVKKELHPVEEDSSSLQTISTNTVAIRGLEAITDSARAARPQSKVRDTTPVNVRGKKKFVCKTCKFKSCSRKELHEHLCAFQTFYSCKHCSKYFYNKALLRKHTLQAACTHKTCTRCNVSFSSQEELARHQSFHFKVMAFTNEEDLRSCDCGKRFACELMLTCHRKTHTRMDGKSYNVCDKGSTHSCDVCGKCFYDFNQLEGHKRDHNCGNKAPRPVESKQVSSDQTSNAPMTTAKEASVGPFKCTLCPRTFSLRHFLSNHVKIHYRAHNLPFVCNECPSRFNSRPKLKKHQYLTHYKANNENTSAVRLENSSASIDDKSHKSNLPGHESTALSRGRKLQASRSSKALLGHKRGRITTTNVGKKSGALHVVGKSGGSVSRNVRSEASAAGAELAARLPVHSGKDSEDRPASDLQCSTCNKSFSSRESRLRHQRLHEAGHQKCLACKVCSKKLPSQKAYAAHVKVHGHACRNKRGKTFKNEVVPEHPGPVAAGTDNGGKVRERSLPPAARPLPSVDDNVCAQLDKTLSDGVDVAPAPAVTGEVLRPLNVNVRSKKQHVIYKTSSGFKCGVCGKLTATLHGGKLHMKLHPHDGSVKVKNRFTCPFCSRVMNSLNATYKHIAANHPDANVC